MPYIKRQASIINGADACGAGMKKAGIVSSMGMGRIPAKILKSRTQQSVPKFMLTCCSTRGDNLYHGGPQYSLRNATH
jgi:hypothetical protein